LLAAALSVAALPEHTAVPAGCVVKAGLAYTVAVAPAAADWHVTPPAVTFALTVAVFAPAVEVLNVYDEPLAVPADAIQAYVAPATGEVT
jgi:hypothetical protein